MQQSSECEQKTFQRRMTPNANPSRGICQAAAGDCYTSGRATKVLSPRTAISLYQDMCSAGQRFRLSAAEVPPKMVPHRDRLRVSSDRPLPRIAADTTGELCRDRRPNLRITGWCRWETHEVIANRVTNLVDLQCEQ